MQTALAHNVDIGSGDGLTEAVLGRCGASVRAGDKEEVRVANDLLGGPDLQQVEMTTAGRAWDLCAEVPGMQWVQGSPTMGQAWLLGTSSQICQGWVPMLRQELCSCTQAARLAGRFMATGPSLLHVVRQPSGQLQDVQHSCHHAPPLQEPLPCMPM